MASIAQQVIGAELKPAQQEESVIDQFSKASQIAQRMEQAQINRQKLEQQKKQFELTKITTFADQIFKMDKMKDPKSQMNFQNNYLPKIAAASGIEYDKGQIKFLTTKENRAKLAYIKGLAEKGEINIQTVLDIMKDPEGTLPDVDLPAAFAAGLDIGKVGEAISEGTSKFLGRQSQEKARGLQGEKFAFQQTKEKRDRLQSVKKDFTAQITKLKPRLEAADNALSLLASGKPISEEVVKTQMARLSGEVGNLTVEDVKRFGGSQAILDRAKQFGETLLTGKLTPENKKQLVEIARIFRKVVADKVSNVGATSIKSARQLGLTSEEVASFIDVESVLKPPSKQGTKKAPGAKKAITSLADFDAIDPKDQERMAKARNTTVEELRKRFRSK